MYIYNLCKYKTININKIDASTCKFRAESFTESAVNWMDRGNRLVNKFDRTAGFFL